MFPYPDWFTDLDRDRIYQASGPAMAPMVMEDLSLSYATEAAAVQGVLVFLEVVVRVVEGHRGRCPPDELRTAAENLRDEIIAWAGRRQFTSTLDAFVAAVEAALQTCPWWLAFLGTPSTPRQTIEHARAEQQPSPRLADWLAAQMRAADVTPSRLELFGGPDGKTTQRLLDGHGTKRDDIKHKLAVALNAARQYRDPTSAPLTLADMPDD